MRKYAKSKKGGRRRRRLDLEDLMHLQKELRQRKAQCDQVKQQVQAKAKVECPGEASCASPPPLCSPSSAIEKSPRTPHRRKKKKISQPSIHRLLQSFECGAKVEKFDTCVLRADKSHSELLLSGHKKHCSEADRPPALTQAPVENHVEFKGDAVMALTSDSARISGDALAEKKLDYFSTFNQKLDKRMARRLRLRASVEDGNDSHASREIKLQEAYYLSSENSVDEGTVSSVNGDEVEAASLLVKPLSFSQYESPNPSAYLRDLLSIAIPTSPFDSSNSYNLDSRTLEAAKKLLRTVIPPTVEDHLPDDLTTLWHFMNSYIDIMSDQQNHFTGHSYRLLYCLHVMNHVHKSRRAVISNNDRLKRLVSEKKSDSSGNDELRDQGFTRTKVLILAHSRSVARELIEYMIKLAPKAKQEEFGLSDQDALEQERSNTKSGKPDDFTHIFDGNRDDCFRIGLRLGTSAMTLYSDFYTSDVIVASPLGLRMLIGTPEDPSREYDFLSSIEMVIVDRADVIRMQNWRFLKDVWSVLNKPLRQWRDTDIRRIRQAIIDGDVACYRQCLVFSDGLDARFIALLSQSPNFRGSIKLCKTPTTPYASILAKMGVRQLFCRVPCASHSRLGTTMMDFFANSVLNEAVQGMKRLLLIVPSYVEYCCIWEYLKEKNLDFKACHESSPAQKISTARRLFFHGDCPILVTTSRFLFYRRYVFRGAVRVLFLGPPEYPQIYDEILRSMESKDSHSICYYTEYHGYELERIMGREKAVQLLKLPEGKWTLVK